MDSLISIIVPVYNAEKTLHRCVESLQMQIYPNLEIVLVNDGSKDNSLSLCRELAAADRRIKVIDKPNGGVSSARNIGMDSSEGDYIMFCDSDDWVEPDWVSTLYENRQPEGLAVCLIDDPSIENEEYPVETEYIERERYMHRPTMMCSPVNKLFSKIIIDRNKLRFVEELRLGEDFCFCMSYLSCAKGKVFYIYRRLYHYIVESEDSLSKSIPSAEQCERFYQELTAAMNRIGIRDKQSIATRNVFVMSHIERFIEKTACRTDISFVEKISIAGAVARLESTTACCENGVKWGNPIYIWFMRHNMVRLAMVFLVLRSVRNNLVK